MIIHFSYVSFLATPVAVPSRRRGFSECSRGIRSPMTSLSSSPKYVDYFQQAGITPPNEDPKLFIGRGIVLYKLFIFLFLCVHVCVHVESKNVLVQKLKLILELYKYYQLEKCYINSPCRLIR